MAIHKDKLMKPKSAYLNSLMEPKQNIAMEQNNNSHPNELKQYIKILEHKILKQYIKILEHKIESLSTAHGQNQIQYNNYRPRSKTFQKQNRQQYNTNRPAPRCHPCGRQSGSNYPTHIGD